MYISEICVNLHNLIVRMSQDGLLDSRGEYEGVDLVIEFLVEEEEELLNHGHTYGRADGDSIGNEHTDGERTY